MSINKIILFSGLFFFVLISSCSLVTNTYINNIPNVQTCDSCKLQSAGYLGFKHLETAISVPITKRLIFQTNAYFRENATFCEIGGGFHYNKSMSIIEPLFFFTYGLGNLHDSGYQDWSEVTWDYNVKYNRFNIVSGVKLALFEELSLTLGSSIARVKFDQYYFHYLDADTHPLSSGETVEDYIDMHDIFGVIVTPFLSIDLHLNKNFDLNMQFSQSWANFSSLSNYTPYEPAEMIYSKNYPYYLRTNFSIGIRYTIQSFKKNNTTPQQGVEAMPL